MFVFDQMTAIALTTIDIVRPKEFGTQPDSFPDVLLIGAAVVHHTLKRDELSYMIEACSLAASVDEQQVLDFLEDSVTATTSLIAYDMVEFVAPLLRARADRQRHPELSRLLNEFSSDLIDLRTFTPEGVPLPFDLAVKPNQTPTFEEDERRTFGLWAYSQRDTLEVLAKERARLTWHLWIAQLSPEVAHILY